MTGVWKNISRILVVKPSSLGDIIHVFPALAVLKQILPDAEIDFMVNAQFADLLDHSPVPIRKKIIFERKKLGQFRYFLPETIKLIRTLRKERYHLVIDFQGLLRSSFFSFSAGAKYGVCGYANPREKLSALFYRKKAKCTRIHAVDRNVELVNAITGNDLTTPACRIPGKDTAEAPVQGYLLMFPGARWESKRFPAELFADIAAAAIKDGRNVILAGSADEKQLCDQIIKLAGNAPGIRSVAGATTLSELFELVRNSSCVVCNDSGPLHIASILNKHLFAFFGSTDPDKTGPWNSAAKIYRNKTECSGCLKRVCPLKKTLCHDLDREAIIKDILNTEN